MQTKHPVYPPSIEADSFLSAGSSAFAKKRKGLGRPPACAPLEAAAMDPQVYLSAPSVSCKRRLCPIGAPAAAVVCTAAVSANSNSNTTWLGMVVGAPQPLTMLAAKSTYALICKSKPNSGKQHNNELIAGPVGAGLGQQLGPSGLR